MTRLLLVWSPSPEHPRPAVRQSPKGSGLIEAIRCCGSSQTWFSAFVERQYLSTVQFPHSSHVGMTVKARPFRYAQCGGVDVALDNSVRPDLHAFFRPYGAFHPARHHRPSRERIALYVSRLSDDQPVCRDSSFHLSIDSCNSRRRQASRDARRGTDGDFQRFSPVPEFQAMSPRKGAGFTCVLPFPTSSRTWGPVESTPGAREGDYLAPLDPHSQFNIVHFVVGVPARAPCFIPQLDRHSYRLPLVPVYYRQNFEILTSRKASIAMPPTYSRIPSYG